MAIKQIITIPDPVLRRISKPVEHLDKRIQTLLDDMLETMYDAPGIGLAAIQIGTPLRVVVIDVSAAGKRDESLAGEKEKKKDLPAPDPVFLINPEILEVSDEHSSYQEGCLSIPDYFANVERPVSCKVRSLDRHGKENVINAEGILSTCLQHEIDHLNGILFIDYLSRLRRDMVIKKFSRIAKQSRREFDKSATG